MNIATNPFDFQGSPLDYLLRLRPKVSLQPIENLQVENRVDTVYTLLLGPDKFNVYKLDKATNFLMYADISTAKFKTKHKIVVGTTKQEVIKILSVFKVTTIPDYLILENLSVPEYLTFKFDRTSVTRIIFNGYID